MGGQGFGELLRSRRECLQLTQEELADRAGLGVRTIRELEAGRVSRPRGHSLRLLCEALALDGEARADFASLAYDDGRPPGVAAVLCWVPGQLPADMVGFIARPLVIRALDGALDEDGGSGSFGVGIAVVMLACGLSCSDRLMDRTPPRRGKPEQRRASL